MASPACSSAIVLSGALLVLSGAAWAQPNAGETTLRDGLLACGEVSASMKRLACYDALLEPLGVLAAEVSPDAPIAEAGEGVAPIDAFGLAPDPADAPSVPSMTTGQPVLTTEAPRPPQPAPVEEAVEETEPTRIILTIESVEERRDGKLRFVMENGQVWAQTDGKTMFVPRSPEEPLAAHIRKGVFGSFLLRINDRGASIRVRRVE